MSINYTRTTPSYTNFRSHAPDVTITIDADGKRFIASAQVFEHFFKFSIPIMEGDLEDIMKSLYEALEDAQADADADLFSPEAFEQHIGNLANKGHSAFNRIFQSSEAQPFLKTLETQAGASLHVQITSDVFVIPWELLYPDSPATANYLNFWGFKYQLSRWPPIQYRTDPSPSTIVTSLPRIGCLMNDSFDGVQEERHMFELLEASNKISLDVLDKLAREKQERDLNKFRRFISRSFDITHFACHAEYSGNGEYGIELTHQFQVQLDNLLSPAAPELRARMSDWKNRSFMIMNACGTGRLHPRHSLHFASLFLGRGARAVVVAQSSVPDRFGAAFTRHLYRNLLNSVPLGLSILRSRHHFARRKNPLGLIYCLYGPLNVRVMVERAGE